MGLGTGMLCVPCCSGLSMPDCHSIGPCPRPTPPLTEPDAGRVPTDSIDATGPVPAEPIVACREEPFVPQMSQAREPNGGFLACPSSYEGQSCLRTVVHLGAWHARLIPLRPAAKPLAWAEALGRHCPADRDGDDADDRPAPVPPLL
jgi:hypothetical protein